MSHKTISKILTAIALIIILHAFTYQSVFSFVQVFIGVIVLGFAVENLLKIEE